MYRASQTECGFHSKCNGKLQKYFKQGSDELKSVRSQDGTGWLCGEGRQL